jgi:hypothetical protein
MLATLITSSVGKAAERAAEEWRCERCVAEFPADSDLPAVGRDGSVGVATPFGVPAQCAPGYSRGLALTTRTSSAEVKERADVSGP